MYLLFCSNFRNMFTWNIHDDCIFVFIWFGIIYNLIKWSICMCNAVSEKETWLLRICPKFRYLLLSYFLLWWSLLMTNVKILINDTHIYKSLLLEVIEDSAVFTCWYPVLALFLVNLLIFISEVEVDAFNVTLHSDSKWWGQRIIYTETHTDIIICQCKG